MVVTTNQKIVISGDHQTEEEITGRTERMNNYNNNNIRSSREECFVVNIDYLSLLGNERSDISSSSSSNSTSTIHHFQRSLSRKGSSSSSHQRGGKATQQTQKDTSTAAAGGSSVGVGGGVVDVGADYHHHHHHHHHESYSNKGASLMTGISNLNKQPSIIVVGGDDGSVVVGATAGTGSGSGTENINSSNTKTVKETVTITPESSKWKKRYNSINQRSPTTSSSFSNWMMDPRRILLFFATLSSMGTIILIYFTLSMAKLDGEDMAAVSHSQPQ